jgi:uncharacterized membrane protein
MPLSETLQYTVVFAITIIFTAISLTLDIYPALTKLIAGLCWFIMGLLQFVLGGAQSVLTIPLTFLFIAFGLVFWFFGFQEFFEIKKEKWNKWE